MFTIELTANGCRLLYNGDPVATFEAGWVDFAKDLAVERNDEIEADEIEARLRT